MSLTRSRSRRTAGAGHGVEAMTMAAAIPLAAGVTLSYRLPLLFAAMTGTGSWQDPEFLRMTSEKAHALGVSAAAAGKALIDGQQALSSYALAQSQANFALLGMASRPAASQAYANESLQRFYRAAAALGEIGSRALATSLRPVHGKVTANARRLGAKGRRR